MVRFIFILLSFYEAQEDLDAFQKKAYQLLEQKQYHDLIALADKKIREENNYHFGLYCRGLGNFYEKKYNESIKDFSSAIEIERNVYEYYHARGCAKEKLNDLAGAISDFSLAIAIDGKRADSYAERGRVHKFMKNYNEAIDDFSQAIEYQPKNILLYMARGNCFFLIEKYSQALENYNKCLDLDKYYGEAYLRRAILHLERRENNKALSDLEAAKKISPKLPYLSYYFGKYNMNVGYLDKSIMCFSEEIIQNEDCFEAYFYRAIAYSKKENLNLCIKDLDKSHALRPNSSVSLRAKGEILLEANKIDEALNALSRAIEIDPNDASLYLIRSKIFDKLNKKIDAEKDRLKYKKLTTYRS